MKTQEETALATTSSESHELAPAAASALAEAEIRAAITVALKFPRNEDRAFQALMRACTRSSFADEVNYSYPRGGETVAGPSIYLAREAARLWGNLRHGVVIVSDTESSRTIEAFAFDLETNTKVSAQDSFEKLVFRKKGGWVKPDERDMRELTNRRAAILKRNCILEILPKDLIEDARAQATETLKKSAEQDPDAARKKLLVAFGSLNITAAMLEQYLAHSIATCSPSELAQLRQIYKSVADGNSTWDDYVKRAGTATVATVAATATTAKLSDVMTVGIELGWGQPAIMKFVKDHFNKELTALDSGEECFAVVGAMRKYAENLAIDKQIAETT